MEQPYGIPFARADFEEVLELALQPAEQPQLFCTCNLNHLRQLQNNTAFQEAYRIAAVITLDSRPIQTLVRMQSGQSLPLVTGADLFHVLIERIRPGLDRPFFTASSTEAANELRDRLVGRGFAADSIGHVVPPFGFENDQGYSDRLVEHLQEFSPTHMFMGVGAPKSEIWIARNFLRLPSANIFCVGAALEFTAGLKDRAPSWIRRLSLEWLHRLASEPRRLLPRYVGDALFLAKVLAGSPLTQLSRQNLDKAPLPSSAND